MPVAEGSSTLTRRAALFRNGANQALRIPKVFEFPGKEVIIHREGDRLVIEPVLLSVGLLAVLADLEPLDEDFPNVDQGLEPLDSVDL